jgi:HAD superfamily hydrolase (TIGR01490 family)
MNNSKTNIWSFFDLDGTLINKDSFLYFLLNWKLKHPRKILSLLFLPVKFLLYLTIHHDRGYIKEAFLSSFMKGVKRFEIEQFVANFWEKFLPKHQNNIVVERLYWHYQNHHNVYIVTASLDFYTKHLSKIWPVDGVISTKAEWNGDTLTGKLKSNNCKGSEKTKRIKKELNIDLKNITYYAYSDNKSDLPLLRHATYPIFVQSGKLEQVKI